MAITEFREYYIRCDGCCDLVIKGEDSITEFFRESGWIRFIDGEIYCPKCKEERKWR